MSGHSHFSSIKHKKGIADQKRGQMFSKLLSAVTAAARTEHPPHKKVMWGINPRLRTAIQKAREANVPSENIERAIKRAKDSGAVLEELMLEAYGPAGTAILIEAITDNKNRTIPEIKKILNEQGAKWAESGSVAWAFDKIADQRGFTPTPNFGVGAGADKRGMNTDEKWHAKFPQALNEEDTRKLGILIEALEEHDDVQKIYTNAEFNAQ